MVDQSVCKINKITDGIYNDGIFAASAGLFGMVPFAYLYNRKNYSFNCSNVFLKLPRLEVLSLFLLSYESWKYIAFIWCSLGPVYALLFWY